MGGRAPQRGRAERRRRPVRGLRRLHELRQPGGAALQHRPGGRRGEARRGRDPLRLRPAPGRADRLDALPRTEGDARAVDRALPRGDPAALAGTDTLVGASVFGVAATRPEEVAQDIPAMARQVDYIAPMLYPSHWGPGEYRVADPNGQPYAIVLRSTRDFVKRVRGTGRARRELDPGLLARPGLRAAGGAGADPTPRATPASTSSSSGMRRSPTPPTRSTHRRACPRSSSPPSRRRGRRCPCGSRTPATSLSPL